MVKLMIVGMTRMITLIVGVTSMVKLMIVGMTRMVKLMLVGVQTYENHWEQGMVKSHDQTTSIPVFALNNLMLVMIVNKTKPNFQVE